VVLNKNSNKPFYNYKSQKVIYHDEKDSE